MNENKIVRTLQDAGCDETVINSFLDKLHNGDEKTALKLLDRHRSQLLGTVHTGEQQIKCLDYFVYMLNRNKENYHEKLQ